MTPTPHLLLAAIDPSGVGILLGLVSVVALVIAGARRNDELETSLRSAARARGGKVGRGGFVSLPRLQFAEDGAAVRLEYVNSGGKVPERYTDVTVEFDGCAPALSLRPEDFVAGFVKLFGAQDLEIGARDFDARWVIKGDRAAARALLDASVRAALGTLRRSRAKDGTSLTMASHGGRTRVELRVVDWIVEPDELRTHLDLCLALVRALRAARRGPWERAAQATGLALSEVDGLPRLTGTIEGAPVEVRVEPVFSGWVTTATVTLRGPRGLYVIHRDHAPDDLARHPMGNPLLDMAVAVGGDDPRNLRALLADGERAAAVLDLVHQHPGSVITENHAKLVTKGWALEGLEDMVAPLAALVRAWPKADHRDAWATRGAQGDRVTRRAERERS